MAKMLGLGPKGPEFELLFLAKNSEAWSSKH